MAGSGSLGRRCCCCGTASCAPPWTGLRGHRRSMAAGRLLKPGRLSLHTLSLQDPTCCWLSSVGQRHFLTTLHMAELASLLTCAFRLQHDLHPSEVPHTAANTSLLAVLRHSHAERTQDGRPSIQDACLRREQVAAVSDFAARVRAVKQWPDLPVSANVRHPVWGASTGSNQQRRALLDNLLQVSSVPCVRTDGLKTHQAFRL